MVDPAKVGLLVWTLALVGEGEKVPDEEQSVEYFVVVDLDRPVPDEDEADEDGSEGSRDGL